jgi:hypothetical protein
MAAERFMMLGQIRPGGRIEVAECRRETVCAVPKRRATCRPEGILQPLGQGDMAFPTRDDRGMFEAQPRQAEVEQPVRQGLTANRDTKTRQVGKVRNPHPTGLMNLPKDDVLFRTMPGAPRPNAPFQGAADTGPEFRREMQHLFEDRCGTMARRFVGKRDNLCIEDCLKRVGPAPFTRLRLL